MKRALLAILSFLLILFIYSQEKSGVKIAIKQEVLYGFEKQFLPLLVEELGKINIPDTNFDIDAGISTLHINLSEIHFKINNLPAENIEITLNEPDIVCVKANRITGDGSLKVHSKLGFISETDIVRVQVKNVNIDADASLTTQESKQVPGKLLPSAYVSRININVDFDFHVDGSVIAFVANLVKSLIKNYINEQINTQLRQIIMDESKYIISDLVSQLPVYVSLDYKGLAIDYSLISPPRISDGHLLLNSNGAIIKLDSKSSKDIPYKYSDMPDFDPNGKPIQMFLSEYSIATAINSLYEANLFEVTLNPEDIPKDSPFQLNTTSLSILINGLSDFYGKNRPVRLHANVSELPKFEISEHLVDTSVVTELTVYVQLESGEWDQALKFSTNVLASGDAIVQTQGQISGHIHSLKLSDSKMIESKIKDANVSNIEIVFNFSSKLLIPILNENFLKSITVKLPTIEGISFEDSTVDIPSNYVEMNVNPQFAVNITRSYLQRRSVFLQIAQENLVPLFLN
jgi:hypothetical protein